MKSRTLLSRAWKKHYALPSEHGAWIWWIGPMAVGVAAAGRVVPELVILFLCALAAFLMRQPATLLVKTLSGRRAVQDRSPALLWLGVYLLFALVGLASLVQAGHVRLLLLPIPGLAVFAWHLWLIVRRAERGQPGIEVIAAGVLALTAPASYWTAGGPSDAQAWLLWGLTWFQAAASIVYVHLRLRQRRLEEAPALRERWGMGGRALAYAAFNVAASVLLLAMGWVPWFVPVAFAAMLLDTAEGVLRPARGVRPAAIGVRQLAMSTLFVAMLVIGYLL